jgi:hypothetical protein
VPGDTQRGLTVRNEFSHVTFKHVLLPIWIAAYRYNGKPYQFLVNGQTGEVVGKAPWSFWKIFFFCLFIAAVIGVGVFVYTRYADNKRQQHNPPAQLAPARPAPARPAPGAPPGRSRH